MDFDNVEKICQIKNVLSDNKDKFNGIGLSNGLLGLSLFHYYSFKYFNQEEDLDFSLEILENCIEQLDENYSSYTTKTDIIELGLYIQFLTDHNILDTEDSLLNDLDEIILEITNEEIDKKNLHNITGALSGGTYFLKRHSFTKRESILKDILQVIEEKKITKSDQEIYWEFDFRGVNCVETNLNHGIAGILSFLIKLYKAGIETKRCRQLILSGVRFILSQKQISNNNWFPQFAFQNDFSEYSNLSYGDIGIGYILIKAGENINDERMVTEGLKVLDHWAKYREEQPKYIKDANLIYGTIGLSSFFYHLSRNYEIASFRDAHLYWYKKTAEFNSENSKWAGYSSYFNSDQDYAHLSFSQGISGIGIALLSHLTNDSELFLNFLKYDI
ncbi:lanthionine synthetase LanC family protein [Chryseobacterium paridis]|uniref:Lanthionine synthetase n=1 Tax=Chryseobacterium paridis TaxID=2800328 RepID=A0ABS1FYK8_9FLAO|nr:lanthionine synthetase LanC family protein [Chryseobacterium paridis]MBK1897534.1 hypothetical protein [Chryseobacterium paridis]